MNVFKFIALLLLSVRVLGQATPGSYPYIKPLPATGGTPGGTLKVTAPMNPTAYQDSRPVVWDAFIGGGLRSVGTTAERDAINAGRRKEGMWVYVADDQHMYSLSTNLTSWLDLGQVGTNMFSGGLSGSGTSGAIPKFTGTDSIGDSILSESGTVVSSSGSVNVVTEYQIGGFPVIRNYSDNISIGNNNLSGFYSQSGVDNIGVGYHAIDTLSTGNENIAIGPLTMEIATSASRNTIIGSLSGQSITTGANNTAIGYSSLNANSTAIHNIAVGSFSLLNTTSSDNIGIGFNSLAINSSGIKNIAIGTESLYNNNGNANISVGYQSLFSNTSGGFNIAIGNASQRNGVSSINNVSIGPNALFENIDGEASVAIGYNALQNATSVSRTVAIGGYSGNGVTTGNNNVLVGSSITSASYNQITSGSGNISIGYDVAVQSDTANNQLCIGNMIYGTGLSGTGVSVSGSGLIGIGVKAPSVMLDVAGAGKFGAPVRWKNYTVAALPAGTQGDNAYVTDALAPSYLATVVGGGSVVVPVFYNGSNWVAH